METVYRQLAELIKSHDINHASASIIWKNIVKPCVLNVGSFCFSRCPESQDMINGNGRYSPLETCELLAHIWKIYEADFNLKKILRSIKSRADKELYHIKPITEGNRALDNPVFKSKRLAYVLDIAYLFCKRFDCFE